MTFQHKFKPFYVIHNTFEQFLQSIPVIGSVESERKAIPAQECDDSHGQHQHGISAWTADEPAVAQQGQTFAEPVTRRKQRCEQGADCAAKGVDQLS